MGLIKIWKKITYRTEDTTNYWDLERQSGQVRGAMDQRGINDSNDPDQPQALDLTDLRRINRDS